MEQVRDDSLGLVIVGAFLWAVGAVVYVGTVVYRTAVQEQPVGAVLQDDRAYLASERNNGARVARSLARNAAVSVFSGNTPAVLQ